MGVACKKHAHPPATRASRRACCQWNGAVQKLSQFLSSWAGMIFKYCVAGARSIATASPHDGSICAAVTIWKLWSLHGRGGWSVSCLECQEGVSGVTTFDGTPHSTGHAERAGGLVSPHGAWPLQDLICCLGPPEAQPDHGRIRHRILHSEGTGPKRTCQKGPSGPSSARSTLALAHADIVAPSLCETGVESIAWWDACC